MRMMPVVPLLAVAALLLSGCSAPATAAGSSTATFQTLAELKSAFVSAGGTCRAWVEDDDIRAAAQSGTCANGVTLSTYLSPADVVAEVTLLRDTASGGDDASGDPPRTELLIGTDWLISGEHVRQLQPKTGGRLVVINPSASS